MDDSSKFGQLPCPHSLVSTTISIYNSTVEVTVRGRQDPTMIKRRSIIRAAGAATLLPFAGGGFAGSNTRPRILFMGGTGFIGPHIVRALSGAGYEVTLFNRGKTNPHLFPELKKIRGDRTTADIHQVAGAKWDLVVDTSCFIPRAVDLLMSALDPTTVRQYVFISTILVYRDYSRPGLHEGSPLADMDNDPGSEDVRRYYGPLKARCEERAEQALPGRVTRLRCGQIIGPGDDTDHFTYWPERVAHDSEVLAPGSGDDYVQTIDARDLADWVVHCVRNKLVGPYNTTNPAGLYTLHDVLGLCRKHLNPDARLTWVSADFLLAHGVSPLHDLPLWVPPGTPSSGVWQVDASLAAAKGLKARPLAQTIVDTHQWFHTLPRRRQRRLKAGISLERQAELLTAWHAANPA